MADIILATLNARYIHSSFGLRYLFANLNELQSRARILEFETSQRPLDIVEAILKLNPQIIGFGVYIWNAGGTLEVIRLLKRLRPSVTVIIGGPEVSYEVEQQEICGLADYVITGEADLTFYETCRQIIDNRPPSQRVIHSPLPDLSQINLPYEYYTEDDLKNRVLYVEASRGCPFTCEFCLSSLDIPVRKFDLSKLLAEFEKLLARGASHFKFVDRTFNLNPRVSLTILEFFLERLRPGLFLHFEMVPDRLPGALKEIIPKYPPGSLQFEIGIQTFNPEVQRLISRIQDMEKLRDNMLFLRRQTCVHIHADLIAGLPGESLESFAAGFNQLVEWGPQEIQVGILKRLRGTPIIRHDQEWGMTWSPMPPYEILETKLIGFKQMQELRLFARYWDLVANSGNFNSTAKLLLTTQSNSFSAFNAFCRYLFSKVGARSGINLNALASHLFLYLKEQIGVDEETASAAVLDDFRRCGRREIPKALNTFAERRNANPIVSVAGKLLPKRQEKHTSLKV